MKSKKPDEHRPTNIRLKGENFYRDANKVKYLNMLKSGKPTHNRQGKIVKAAAFQSSKTTIARVEPNRKWFGNTRVIGQQALDNFRQEIDKTTHDPYKVLLRRNKIPLSLLKDSTKVSRAHMLDTESFGYTFGPGAQRKRPKIGAVSLEEYESAATEQTDVYDDAKDNNLLANQQFDYLDEVRDKIFSKGQSKRIWNELYKVIDSSDVVVHVLDARDPIGTRCRNVETYLKAEAAHKHLIFVLNKWYQRGRQQSGWQHSARNIQHWRSMRASTTVLARER
jgi:nuclear GTP-binding protein